MATRRVGMIASSLKRIAAKLADHRNVPQIGFQARLDHTRQGRAVHRCDPLCPNTLHGRMSVFRVCPGVSNRAKVGVAEDARPHAPETFHQIYPCRNVDTSAKSGNRLARLAAGSEGTATGKYFSDGHET